MSAIEPMQPVVRGLIGPDGALREADPWLAELNARAGGRIGLALAEADRRRDAAGFVELVDPLMAMPAAAVETTVAAFKLPAVYHDACAALERGG